VTGLAVGLLCAATWAVDSVLMRNLAKKLDPITLNAPRTLVGGLVAFLFTAATGRIHQYESVTSSQIFLLVGGIVIAGGIGDCLYFHSLAHVGVSTAFPVSSGYPAITMMIGLALLSESINAAIVAGLTLVLVGILLISRRPASGEEHPPAAGTPWGIPAALMASICWGVAPVLTAQGIGGLDAITVTSIRTPALSLLLWGIVALRGSFSRLLKLSAKEWLTLIVGGLIGWGLGSALYVLAVAQEGSTRAAILTATAPLFALPLSTIFLKEKVSLTTLGGTALTVAGVILVS